MEDETSPIFTDSKGVSWDLTITLGDARRIDKADFSELCDKPFSFLHPDQDLFRLIISNGPLSCAMATIVAARQMEKKLGLDYDALDAANWSKVEAEFESRLDGPAIGRLKAAWMRAVSDFFPEAKTGLSSLMKKLAARQTKMNQMLQDRDQQLEDLLDLEMKEAEMELDSTLRKAKEDIGERLMKSQEHSDGVPATQTASVSEGS